MEWLKLKKVADKDNPNVIGVVRGSMQKPACIWSTSTQVMFL